MGLKILVTGGSGQVGNELVRHLRTRSFVGEIVAPSSSGLNLANRDSVLCAIRDVAPDWIYHVGAWTNVDGCEDDPERAFLINGLGTRFVVQGAQMTGARICYISTDYVFDGSATKPYLEWDRVGPQTVYGASKLAGEKELRTSDVVVRTSWVMGEFGHNMAKTLIGLSAREGSFNFVDDQLGSPTVVADLVVVLGDLVAQAQSGIFHVSGAGEASWYDVARFVFSCLGDDPGRILPIKSAELLGYKARRPAYSVLANFATTNSGVKPMPRWEESLKVLIQKLRDTAKA